MSLVTLTYQILEQRMAVSTAAGLSTPLDPPNIHLDWISMVIFYSWLSLSNGDLFTGPPFIRSIGPLKAIAGSDVVLHCPYSGYPIVSVRWERYGQELPLDLRHKIHESGSFSIASVDQSADSGYYACSVTSKDGEVARREIQLIVHSPPILEPFSFPSSLQEGSRAQVTCYVTSGDMPIHFSWYKDDAPIPSSLQVRKHFLTTYYKHC